MGRELQQYRSQRAVSTDWLNMMYPRLKLARDLLRDDGIIFVSLDDNEASNLKRSVVKYSVKKTS